MYILCGLICHVNVYCVCVDNNMYVYVSQMQKYYTVIKMHVLDIRWIFAPSHTSISINLV